MSNGWDLFFSNGLQYYAAGRYSVFAGGNYVAGNILHHAVEMCLKGALEKAGWTLPKLRSLKHDLPKIWRKFKSETGATGLDKFDDEIEALHAYEKIRYPDEIMRGGMHSLIGLRRADLHASSGAGSRHRFQLSLESVDDLILPSPERQA
jgi:HEPN domain-containing protein